jgi:hypothetical protein
MAERIAQCLSLEHEVHQTVSKLCILGFEPLEWMAERIAQCLSLEHEVGVRQLFWFCGRDREDSIEC